MLTSKAKKKIVLYGAQGLGRETAYLLSLLPEWETIGYFDDNIQIGKTIGYDQLPVLDFADAVTRYEELFIVICIANPVAKQKVYEKVREHHNIKLPPIVAPTAMVAPDAEISEGCIIGHFAVLGPNTRIGKCVLMNTKTAVGHDTVIGDFTTILSSTNISGNVVVGNSCFFGDQSFIMQGKNVGDRVTVGAGSRVFTNVPDDQNVFGYPATRI